jgi:hypothetical protein
MIGEKATVEINPTWKAAEDAAWPSALAPVVVACGVRPLFIDGVLEGARSVFELATERFDRSRAFTTRDPDCGTRPRDGPQTCGPGRTVS